MALMLLVTNAYDNERTAQTQWLAQVYPGFIPGTSVCK